MTPVLLSSLGWVSTVTDAIVDSLSWAFNLFSTLITYLFNFLFSVIIQGVGIVFGTFLQWVLFYLLHIVDVFQDFFDVFAGTKTVKNEGNEMYLLDVFLTNDGVKQALLAVTFIGIAICFIFTIYSVAKSMGSYALEHKRPISHVMKTALKSCIAFMIVPVMMYFGSQLSSAILISTQNAIVGVTGSDEAPRLSTILFLSGTFGDDDEPNASFTTGKRAAYFGGSDYKGEKKSIYNPGDYLVDFNMYPSLDLDNILAVFQSQADDVKVADKAADNLKNNKNNNNDGFSLDDLSKNAKTFPSMFETLYNYPLVYIASLGVILILLCSTFVFIRKIIEVIILYITSPLFVATMPLDGGTTFKRWRDMFVGKLLSGFGIVISMNLVFIFIPMIMSSNFSFSGNMALDVTLKIVFVIGSMYAAWKSNTTILEVINPEIAASDRASAMVVAGMVKMAANTAKDAALAAATGGGSLAAKGAASAAKGAAAASKGAASAASNAANGAASAAKGSGNAFTGGTGGGSGISKIAKMGNEMASSGGSNKKDDEEKK
ncbi:MAG: hypothetical protein J6C38_04985 [Oscillospiraceae bacterium]|nr:hypothetical protein [Oscillospiraceae bacterium]